MDKPITVIRQEVINELSDTINNSGLPPFVLKPIVQDILNQIILAENSQYNYDKEQYEKSLYEKTSDDNDNGEGGV